MLNHKKVRRIIAALCAVVLLEAIAIVVLWFKLPQKRPLVLKPPLVAKGKIAIVIDDWGYHEPNHALLNSLDYPLTMSILPHLAYTKAVALDLHQRGYEIILHLPMEPRENMKLEKETIRVSMDAKTIKNIISRALASVPYALGVSNHMGSKLTANPQAMRVVLGELKLRNLFFLDSYVTGSSVGREISRELGVRFVQRDVFLDNDSDVASIKQQIEKLKMQARLYGEAVGIGHDRKNTLEVLKEALPQLEEEGYKLVFVSELAR
ncbi:MAG: divergent polysaccharide deacetylase family protein [Candidatus Omnitrophica bacterium]|nr:divergent polysaccharide deacetylase family protein [Candidatus Omnitrophota bacterium]